MFENTFSRRTGYTPPPVQGNREELSDHARNRLWNVFYIDISRANQFDDLQGGLVLAGDFDLFLQIVWIELYHGRFDEYPGSEQFLRKLTHDFLQGLWHFPFDIFEAISSFRRT